MDDRTDRGRSMSVVRTVAAAGGLLVLVQLGLMVTHDPTWHARELAIDQATIDGAPWWVYRTSESLGTLFAPGGALVMVALVAVVTAAVRRRGEPVLTYLAVTLVPWWASEALKLVVQRPRPAVRGVMPVDTPVTWSYPSGHAAVATALVIGALVVLAPALRGRRVARALAIAAGVVVIAAVAVSRVVLAVHYPTDVIAGPLCASAFAVLVGEARAVLVRRRRARQTSGKRSVTTTAPTPDTITDATGTPR